MKNPLSKRVICLTGEFSQSRDKIKQWIEANGGKLVSSISSANGATHLICSESHWKRQVALVQQALKHKKVKIVSYDWLEDSLTNRSPRREGAYLCAKLFKARPKQTKPAKSLLSAALGQTTHRNAAVSKASKPKKRGAKPFFDAVIDDLKKTHHVYRDHAGNDYSVGPPLLDFNNNKAKRNNRVRIFESNAEPHTYAATNTFYHTQSNPPRATTSVLVEQGSALAAAREGFCRYYKWATGVAWDFRAWGPQVVECPTFFREDGGRGGEEGIKVLERRGKRFVVEEEEGEGE